MLNLALIKSLDLTSSWQEMEGLNKLNDNIRKQQTNPEGEVHYGTTVPVSSTSQSKKEAGAILGQVAPLTSGAKSFFVMGWAAVPCIAGY